MQSSSAIEVDGVAYQVHFQGFREPLHVHLQGGREIALRPWTCGAHLDALGRHLRPAPAGLALDAPSFCGEVLADSGLSADLLPEIGPLALWWAAGGDARPPARPDADGWLELDGARVQLRPWTHGERLRALGDSVVTGPDERTSFDVAAYLGAMLRASVRAWAPGPPRDPRELDAASTAALLDAVVALNVPEGLLEDDLSERLRAGAQEVAALTLRLCRALGWTPSQVAAAPAAEIDRLLELLDVVEGRAGASAAAAPTPRIADHPDAVVIQIEDDPG